MVTRRDLLRGSIVSLSGGIFMPNLFARALAVAQADGSPTVASGPDAGRTLIIIQLAGGNDGLNTVVPYQDGAYYTARPNLGIKAQDVVPLDGRLGLNPALKELKPIWDAGHVAIVESVGYDHPNLSHFQAMDIWQTADPTLQTTDGWLSHLVEGMVDSQGHPLGALALGATLPPTLCCPPTPPPVVDSPSNYKLMFDPRYPKLAGAREDTLKKLYSTYQAPAPYAALLEATSDSAAITTTALQQIVGGYQPKVTYPTGPLADGLKVFAAMIAGGHGMRIGYIMLGGFDTHAAQAQHHDQLLATLSTSISAFYGDLDAQGKAQDTLMITWSEFGRRVQENASLGTDHGTAAPMFVIGKAVKGGFYGQPPDLTNLDFGNLKFAVDFRSVYASVLEEWMQADSKAVLGQQFTTIPLLG